LADEDCDGACDRAYYAMFNAARTLLEADGAIAPDEVKSHASVLRLFSEVFVLSGRADRELGRGLNVVQTLRNKADYSRIVATAEEATKAVETMQLMLEFAAEHVERTARGQS
jgi:uncharacterized protein (UPF0332 family)